MVDYNDNRTNMEIQEALDERVIAEVTKDKMLGVISFHPPENGGSMLTIHHVRNKIKEAGIVYGVKEEIVESLLTSKIYNHKYVIAQGTPAVAGQDGKLEYFFNTDIAKTLKPKENEDGTVDFKKLDIIQTVKKDQLLVQVIPPTDGVPGKNVLGQDLRATRGKTVKLPKGKNTYNSQDQLQLYSSIEGQLIYDRQSITISETYVVSESAGTGTGDIDFSGNVVVKGNVMSGFVIKAGGNVEVMGFVEEATIIAGGNIVLRHGIQGKDRGKLVAAGDIFAKFIQNSTVEAEGNVYTEAIMHSHVVAGGSIIVEVNKGLIVGGAVQATNLISAKIIGSPMSTATTVQISITPALHNKHKMLEADMNKKIQQIDQISKNIAFLQNKRLQGVTLSNDKVQRFRQMMEARVVLQQELKEVETEYSALSEVLENYKEGVIQVRDVMYSGSKIVMGATTKFVSEDTKYCTIYVEDADIKIGPYGL